MTALLHDPLAHWLVVAAAVAVVVGEVIATLIGNARDGKRQLFGGLADALLVYRHGAKRQDRGTRLIVGLSAYLGVAAALAIARMPELRLYADNWWTFGLGVGVILAGSPGSATGRSSSARQFGRYFRRSVTIESGQRIVRRGPYRVLRHLVLHRTRVRLRGLRADVRELGRVLPSRCSSRSPGCCRASGSRTTRSPQRSETSTRTMTSSTARLLPHVW